MFSVTTFDTTGYRYIDWTSKPRMLPMNLSLPRQNVCAHDQRSDRHWWHQSPSHKWLRKHEFDRPTCRSRSQCYWRLLSWRDDDVTVTARRALDLKRVLHLSAGQCPADMALKAVNFLTDSIARYRLITKILSRRTHTKFVTKY